MRTTLLASLLLLACEGRGPALAEAPKTAGVEGHGGIAIAAPQPVALPRLGATPGPIEERSPPATRPGQGQDASNTRDLYLRGYQLKDSAPDEAAALFRRVVEAEPEGSELRAKASARLADLGATQR